MSAPTTSTTAGKKVFFLGATGYIGGTVLTSILKSPTPPASVTVLVRDASKGEALSSLSLAAEKNVKITVLQGSLDDADKLVKAASEADCIVNTAHADHLEGAKALIQGMKTRKEKTGHRPLYIHTSGTGVLIDNAKGAYPNDKIYTDLNPTPATAKSPALLSISTLAESAPHREVDLEIILADARGWLKSYIVLPSTIWGAGEGEIYEKGIANSFSDQIPTLIKAALDRGRAGVVGEGKNIWPHVRITDLGQLYQLIWNQSTVVGPTIGHGTAGYYFGISGEYTLWGATSTIGRALVENKFVGKENAQPTPFTEEEIQKYYGGSEYSGTNSRGVADRSKSIGWKPKYVDLEQFYRHVEEETARVEKTFGKEWQGRRTDREYKQ